MDVFFFFHIRKNQMPEDGGGGDTKLSTVKKIS